MPNKPKIDMKRLGELSGLPVTELPAKRGTFRIALPQKIKTPTEKNKKGDVKGKRKNVK